jgi:hypothetical protein
MKLFLIHFLLNIFQPTDNPNNILGVEGPLLFNKSKFELIQSTKPDDNMYKQEYLPKNEAIESYNQKMSLLLIETDTELEDIVTSKIKDLSEYKKKDHNALYSSKEIKNGAEYIVEFTKCDYNGPKVTLVEYNVSKVKRINTNGGKKAILIYTYTWRSYDDETTLFLSSLKNFKEEFILEMSNTETPSVSF